ncbi:putative membrane protein [Hydrogenoanaerobacterium saccharovorans]|uniref:Uncharacterized membrane protein n=1 Tax=Hydrogenoanaerobacterium saccharovorans TaxID=474960 RepID=A0A1H8ABW8_9FIRM|nr:DUF975 family protein [Hydrogenoanaerobacterium saccharovorans]RPF48076.1 putative membrane protein [Hydrogenoanaerobacterium saccharovorans]SEM67308.1 Uncharacterized membrane protein [Hydrogenoanaerobacterium saccharovorans]
MKLRTQIKQNARRALGGNWGKAICIFFVCLTIYVIFSLLQGLISLLLNIPDFQDVLKTPSFYFDDVVNLSQLSIIVAAIFTLLSLIVNSPLTFGVKQWYYHLVGGESDDVVSIFSFFSCCRLFFKVIWHDINLIIRRLLWAIPFSIIPGIITGTAVLMLYNTQPTDIMRLGGIMLFMLGLLLALIAQVFFVIFTNRYFLSAYLIAENPELTVKAAIKTSIRYTKHNKGNIFMLQLSFILWGILSLLVLPLLYVVPYYSAANALYAKYLIERGKLHEPEDETVRFDLHNNVTGEIEKSTAFEQNDTHDK